MAELRGRLLGFCFEYHAHVFWMAEAAAFGDLGKGELGIEQQALGGGDALGDEFLVYRAVESSQFLYLSPNVGPDAPQWIYEKGVPAVKADSQIHDS